MELYNGSIGIYLDDNDAQPDIVLDWTSHAPRNAIIFARGNARQWRVVRQDERGNVVTLAQTREAA